MSTNYVVSASIYDLIEQICFFLVRLALYKKPTLLYRCTGTARLPSPKGEMKAVLSTLFIESNAYQIQNTVYTQKDLRPLLVPLMNYPGLTKNGSNF
jgi:hypothetical protein